MPDICVIGAGAAGLTVAAAARALGISVVLIERGPMGGECLNIGCVPSKALIAAARHAHAVRQAARFGVDAGEPVVDYARVHAHVHRVIAAIAPHDSQERFEKLGATVIRETARFTGPNTMEAGGRTIRAKRFVIATGSRPVVPDVPGLADVLFLTNETLFDLTALPGHLIVIGGGPIGFEMAQAFRRLGSAVTVLQRGPRVLAHDDAECSAIVRRRLEAEGVSIRTEVAVTRVSKDGTGVAVTLGNGETIAGTHLLVAAGRRPQIDGLELGAAGVAATDKGITTDSAMRTSNPRIFAIGDVAGSYRFTHWAGYQGGLVVRTILTHVPARENKSAIAWATYTDPELAHVGLTEAEAREKHGRAVQVLRWPYQGNDRAQAELETDGLVKVITGRRGRILGADIAGAGAGEMAALFALAIAGGLGTRHLSAMVLPYPTLAEAAKRAAVSGYAAKLESGLAQRVLGALRRFI